MAKGRKNQAPGLSKAQKKDEIERKRDERARRAAFKKERDAKQYYPVEDDENYAGFSNQLLAEGLKIKDIPGDGNCLFRALADQYEGDHQMYRKHRADTVHYMRSHKDDFAPFIDLEAFSSFTKYLESLERDGTFAGNDAIVAFARNHEVNVVIHQFNNPRFVIEGISSIAAGMQIELHLAYHNGEHYSSLRRINDPGSGPGYPYHSKKYAENKKTNHIATNTEKRPRGESSIVRKDPSDYEECLTREQKKIVEETGCKDHGLVSKASEEFVDDVDGAIAYVLQVMSIDEGEPLVQGDDVSKHVKENCCCTCSCEEAARAQTCRPSEDLTKPQVGKKMSATSVLKVGASKPQHLSNRQRKELAKQSKKKRREEAKKEQAKDEGKSNVETEVNSSLLDVGTVQI